MTDCRTPSCVDTLMGWNDNIALGKFNNAHKHVRSMYYIVTGLWDSSEVHVLITLSSRLA